MKFGENVIVDTADHSATKLFSQGGEILVLDEGRTRYLGELSEIVRGMPARVWRCRVYAPKAHRETVRTECESWLNANPARRIVINADDRGNS